VDTRDPRHVAAEMIAAWRQLPRVDHDELRRDMDDVVDPLLARDEGATDGD
jgi:hypothetical protein